MKVEKSWFFHYFLSQIGPCGGNQNEVLGDQREAGRKSEPIKTELLKLRERSRLSLTGFACNIKTIQNENFAFKTTLPSVDKIKIVKRLTVLYYVS